MTSGDPGHHQHTDRQRTTLAEHTTHMMGLRLLFIVAVGLLAASHGFPADGDEVKGTDNRVGLDRPITEAPPEVSPCNLDALLGEVFGSSSNTDCPPQQPTNNNGNNLPGPDQNNNNVGYVPNNNNLPEPQPMPPTGSGNNPPENGECTCVQHYLCNENNTFNEDGIGVIDIRIKDEECDNYLLKCCRDQNVQPVDKPLIPKPVPKESSCGVRNFDGIGFRITGNNDNEAQYGEFPWMVAVVRPDLTLSTNDKTVNVYQCGGSLIHPQVVLTAAHCVRGKTNLVIRAGEWDTQTKNELYPTQDRKVRNVIIHEQFNNGSLANDPALLILENPVDMSAENVGLICLPDVNENMDGRDCVASGWGKDLFGKEGKYQVILKRVDVPTVPRAQCLEALRKTRLGNHFKLHESFMCAGGQPGKDTCKGDGGSPLACPRKNNPNIYVQAGIVAWGIDCGTVTPGVYVNVPYFMNWIYNKLQSQGISLESSGQA